MTRYVALLRGINVGGQHVIRMADLKACFEAQGLDDVATYIQSGNVVFGARAATAAAIERRLEAALAASFDCHTRVMLRSRQQMQDVVKRAPRGFGKDPDKYRCDVIFLQAPLTSAAALAAVPNKPGVDQVSAGASVLYFSRLIAKATQSKLGRVVSMPMYKQMTIRNWRTTATLLDML